MHVENCNAKIGNQWGTETANTLYRPYLFVRLLLSVCLCGASLECHSYPAVPSTSPCSSLLYRLTHHRACWRPFPSVLPPKRAQKGKEDEITANVATQRPNLLGPHNLHRRLCRLFATACFFVVYRRFLCNSDYIASIKGERWKMNWKRCGTTLVWPSLKVLSRYFPGRTEENHKTSVRTAGIRAEIWTRDLPNTKLKC
jgi:hypothetical protein